MRKSRVLLLAALLMSARGALAQRRGASPGSAGTGFWYGLGVAPGWARVSCEICASARQTGVSASIALGGRTSRALRIGGELAAWRERDADVTQTLMSIGAAAYWYPNTRRRLYLRGGVALNMHRVNDGTDVVTSSGIGPLMGIGLEWPLGQSWLAGPFAHYSVGVFGGDVKFNGGEAASSATVSFLQVGMSLTRR
jgi:hypothetical protein